MLLTITWAIYGKLMLWVLVAYLVFHVISACRQWVAAYKAGKAHKRDWQDWVEGEEKEGVVQQHAAEERGSMNGVGPVEDAEKKERDG